MKKRFLLGFLLLLLCLWFAPQALAAGSPAGTNITNQAYVDYNDANGNPLTRVFSNTVTTTVSQVAGVALLPQDSTVVGAPGSTVHFAVDVLNTGNGADAYTFTIAGDPGSTFTPDDFRFYYDADNSGDFSTGDILITPVAGVYTVPIAPGTVPADGTFPIVVEVDIPAGATNGQTAISNGTITSQFDTGVSSPGSFTVVVATAVIDALKTHSPASPQPGDTVTYTVTLTNTGSVDGTSTLVNDPIPTGMTYVPGSITLNGAGKTDTVGDADGVDFNATVPGAVYVEAGTVANGGGTAVITFQATVNAGVAAGTTITNQANVSYDYDPGTGSVTINETTNGDLLTVASAPSVAVTPGTTSASGDPGDLITYAITVDNNGNAADVIDMTYTSSENWTWTLWYDANNDGIAGNDGDFLLTDSDGDGIVDTGSIPAGGSATLLAVTTIPAPPTSANGDIDLLVITGTSSIDTGISDTSGTLTTTVTAPVLTIAKAVSPAGSQPPGTVLTYTVTVTNTGAGTATSVIISDLIPTFTTYVDESIQTGATLGTLVGKTDAAADLDGAEFDSGSNVVIAGSTTKTLGAGGTFILQFQVTIN